LAVSRARRGGRMFVMNDWNDAERRVERAQELFEQRKWQEALEELRAATDINPYNSGWYFNIGLTLDEMGRLDEAVEAYKQALTKPSKRTSRRWPSTPTTCRR
jgi:tetratricopeptide (TPR) repeat protein